MRKLPDTVSKAEIDLLIKHTRLIHHKLAYLLGFYQCLRISEVVGLEAINIDSQRGFIHIKQGKGNKDRDIPIMPELKHYLRYVPIKVGVRALERSIKRIGLKVLKKDIHFHTLRHSGATYYLNKRGIDIRNIQTLLGHSRLDTTQIYTHVTPESLKKAFETPLNPNTNQQSYSR